MARLGDICTINPKSPGFHDKFMVSFVPMPKVGENGEFDPSEVRTYQEVKKGFTYFQNGDVLFAKITPCMENGKGAIAQSLKNGIGFGSTEFHVLRPLSEYVSSKWLFYLLNWQVFRKEAEKNMTGSAGQKRVPKSFLEKYVVNVPDLSTQEKMTSTLDRICDLISFRKEQLAKLDELVKARFGEMFEGEYPMVSAEFICDFIVDCPHSTPKYSGEKLVYPAIRTSEIKDGCITWSSMKYVSHAEYLERTKRLVPIAGDIVYAREGTYGDCVILPEGTNFCLGQRTMLFRPNMTKCTPAYLHQALRSDAVKLQADESNAGSTVPHVNVADAKKFRLPLPPLWLQRQFTEFVEQNSKSKLTIQQSLGKLGTLKKALMQEYFG